MRTIIIGDVHGCAKELSALLDKVKADPERDWLIMLGDLFDRGPESYEVFQIVQKLDKEYGERFVLLLGNHEDFLLAEKLTLKQRMIWDKVGRGATVKSFKEHGGKMEDAIPWIQAHCRLYWKGEGYQCVHAGVKVEPIEANDRQTLIHDHGVIFNNEYKGLLTIVGHVGIENPMWFKGDRDPEVLPYNEERLLPQHGVICIDTGCGKEGVLTAMIIENNKYQLMHM